MKIPNIKCGDIAEKMHYVYRIAQSSDDRSTHIGAVLCEDGWNVVSGFNHLMRGFGHLPEHHERPLKYSITEHAERDVLYSAAYAGIETGGLTMVANWVACPDCARAIVSCGIGCVVAHKQCMDRTPERWREMVDIGLKIMRDGGVELIFWDGKVGKGMTNLNNGEVWYP